MKRRSLKLVLVAAVFLLAGALATPWFIQVFWRIRSSNPVRRGVHRARELGCFSCHGDLGRAGIREPAGSDREVPAWTGGLWMMYVDNDDEIRDLILNGSEEHHEHEAGKTDEGKEEEERVIEMPPFREALRGSDLEDLTAAFHVLSEMTRPPADSPAERGYALAKKWGCFSCHGPGGSGGFPNPGALTGFIPGWYGADFRDLVHGRDEFDRWIRNGSVPRLVANPIAAYFMRRQRLQMPPYKQLTPEELDDLWTYVEWLSRTAGGVKSES